MANRPVTRGGIAGVRPMTSSHTRSVFDVSYYRNLVSAKLKELDAEIQSLGAEAEKREREATATASLERRHEELLQEIRNLEGSAADYNLAQDKLRAGVPAEEVLKYAGVLRERNDRLVKEVDNIFRERKQVSASAQRTGGGR